MGARRALKALCAVLAVVFGGIGLLALLFGMGFGPNSGIQHRCVVATELPSTGGPYFEDTIIRAERLGFPMGLRCIYDSPRDSVGPQVVVHEEWAMTGIMLGSAAIAIGALVIATREERPASMPAQEKRLV